MSSEPRVDAPALTTEKPRNMRFRPRHNQPLLPRDGVKRQGAISTLAFQLIGKEAAIAFLNTDHSGLGGRPLALATESAEGLAAVEAELRRLAALAGTAPTG